MELISLKNTSIVVAAKRAAEILTKGGIVLYPTDTIYGLGVDATNLQALLRLKDLKGRDKKKPISIIVSNYDAIEKYAVMNDIARSLAKRFFPGALTLVLPATRHTSSEITLNDAIGVRIPNDPFCLELAQCFGKPFTSTSANKAGRENVRTVEEAVSQFGHTMEGITLIIDDGERSDTTPSTVVLCTTEVPHISREGAISREELGL